MKIVSNPADNPPWYVGCIAVCTWCGLQALIEAGDPLHSGGDSGGAWFTCPHCKVVGSLKVSPPEKPNRLDRVFRTIRDCLAYRETGACLLALLISFALVMGFYETVYVK